MTMKEQCNKFFDDAISMYNRLSEFEQRCAGRATNSSNIQQESMLACSFNRGRAKAMKEAKQVMNEYFEKYLGQLQRQLPFCIYNLNYFNNAKHFGIVNYK